MHWAPLHAVQCGVRHAFEYADMGCRGTLLMCG